MRSSLEDNRCYFYVTHPLQLFLPVVLLSVNFVADVAYLFHDQSLSWLFMSFWTSLTGALAALFLGVFGLSEFAGRDRYSSQSARIDLILHGCVVVLYATSAYLMGADRGFPLPQLKVALTMQLVAFVVLVTLMVLGSHLLRLAKPNRKASPRPIEAATRTRSATL